MKRGLFAVLLVTLAACNENAAPGGSAGDGAAGTITGFTLLDAATDEALETASLTDGMTLGADGLPERVRLRAETTEGFSGSVQFSLGSTSASDDAAPYTLESWTPAPGSYTLSATPYSDAGTAERPLSVDFTVIETGEPLPEGYRRYLYVMLKTGIAVYDMDNGYRQVKQLDLPDVERIWGVHAHAPSGRLYFSFHDSRTPSGRYERGVVAYDLVAEKIVWRRFYAPFVDSLEVTPDGKTLYMATGEATDKGTFWYALDAATGDVKDTIPVFRGAHNTIVSPDGRRVYMGSVRYPYLAVADTATNEVIQEVGPFRAGVRPFTINGAQTLAFVNVNQFLGFEVGDVRTGKKLFSVPVPGFPSPKWKEALQVQSHGVALTPDEQEVWVVDGYSDRLHIFDASALPEAAPVYKESIALASGPLWLAFSRDGRFAHVSTGDVIDTRTRQVVAKTASSKIRLQIDFVGDRPVQAYSRYGLGYAGGAPD